jgi:epoxyqueuosine reductase
MLDLFSLQAEIRTEVRRLGFSHMGIAPALPVPRYQEYLKWVRAGRHADMGYLSRSDALAKRADPGLILEGCQRVICLAMPYQRPQTPVQQTQSGFGRVSAYARTRDYHETLWEKLTQLEDFIQTRSGGNARLKSYVDTGPILERTFAAYAGIGVPGKNTCLIVPGSGSYFFLAEVLIDLPLPVDAPLTLDLCGACQRCMEACPTGCILPDRTIDAGRCISYLTIENKGLIPDSLKGMVGDWFFGCDMCQMVCPHNAQTAEPGPSLGEPIIPEYIDLVELLTWDEVNFQRELGGTPLLRAKRNGLLRNAALVLGNQCLIEALPGLQDLLSKESDPIVQDACYWAINQITEGMASGSQ